MKHLIITAIIASAALSANAQSGCDPVPQPKGFRAFLYGAGQGMTAHAGLPTDQQIQQQRCQQEMQLKQLELQQRQLEMQRQAIELQQKAAQAEVQKQTCLNNGLAWIQTNYGSYCAGETTLKVAVAPSPVVMPSMTTAETPAQACRNRGFKWYGYCAYNKNTGEQK